MTCLWLYGNSHIDNGHHDFPNTKSIEHHYNLDYSHNEFTIENITYRKYHLEINLDDETLILCGCVYSFMLSTGNPIIHENTSLVNDMGVSSERGLNQSAKLTIERDHDSLSICNYTISWEHT